MKEEGGIWRHELKFVCSAGQLAVIQSRICALMQRDAHAGEDGRYTIRSVYFDDAWDSCFSENEDGTDPREKFRIRIYNASADKITLELKQKMRGMTRKQSCPLTRQQCMEMLAGQGPVLHEQMPAVLKKFLLQQKTRRLLPKVIVEYDRTPWVYRLGNVRVTFDENIHSSCETDRFLEPDFSRRQIMPAGWHVLEVKYDDFLPDPIRQALQLNVLQRTSFSKYYLCRKYRL